MSAHSKDSHDVWPYKFSLLLIEEVFLMLVAFISSWKNYSKVPYYKNLQNYIQFISGSNPSCSLTKQESKTNFTVQ